MKEHLKAIDHWLYSQMTDNQFARLLLLGAIVTFVFFVKGLAEAAQ